MTSSDSLQLAQRAADGDPAARKQVSEIADPMINFQNDKFCKRYCYENRIYYICTLPKPWGSSKSDASLCEWGNGSYGWMLDDLTKENRLRKFEGKDGADLGGYIFSIINSLPFYERWKDWRFGRRVHVPTYIKDMSPHASRIFLALRSGDGPSHISQNMVLEQSIVDALIQKIIVELTQRNRLHLLDPPKSVSLTGYSADDEESGGHQMDIGWQDDTAQDDEVTGLLKEGWDQLDAVEQFVLEAMLIEEQDAEEVLDALVTVGLSIKKGQAPEEIDRQQLYYFRRKTMAKLADLVQIH